MPPPADEYDEVGFGKNAKISFKYKEGFYLNTFISTNIVQDFGFVHAAKTEPSLIRPYDKVYVKFDKSVDVKLEIDFQFINQKEKLNTKLVTVMVIDTPLWLNSSS